MSSKAEMMQVNARNILWHRETKIYVSGVNLVNVSSVQFVSCFVRRQRRQLDHRY
jgi:hypothetical protein